MFPKFPLLLDSRNGYFGNFCSICTFLSLWCYCILMHRFVVCLPPVTGWIAQSIKVKTGNVKLYFTALELLLIPVIKTIHTSWGSEIMLVFLAISCITSSRSGVQWQQIIELSVILQKSWWQAWHTTRVSGHSWSISANEWWCFSRWFRIITCRKCQ